MATKKFPDRIYVVRSSDGDVGSYLVADDKLKHAIEEAGDGGQVAVYERVEVGEAHIVHSLESIK